VYILLDNNKAGGVDTIVKMLCNYQNVTLIVNSGHLERINYRIVKGVKQVIEFQTINDLIQNLPNQLIRFFSIIYNIIDLLTDNYFTIIHAKKQFRKFNLPTNSTLLVVQGGWPASVYGRVALCRFSKNIFKSILNIHNIAVPEIKSCFALNSKLNLQAIKAADTIIFCSEAARSAFPIDINTKGITIYNGIEFPYTQKISDKSSLKTLELGLIGTFESRKGFEDAIFAYKRLHKRLNIGNLHIFGTGTNKEIHNLRKLVVNLELSSFVIFHGYVCDVNSIYNKLDLVIVPSKAYESFGLIQIEAIMRGLPVIVSDHGGLLEVANLINNRNIFKAGDVDSLVDLIERVEKNYSSEITHISSMQENIRKYFSVDLMLKKYAESY